MQPDRKAVEDAPADAMAEARLTLAAIHPTKPERVLGWIVRHAYRRSETGLFGWVGDRADDLRIASWRRRADGTSWS